MLTLLCFAITEARNSLSSCAPITDLAPRTSGAKIPCEVVAPAVLIGNEPGGGSTQRSGSVIFFMPSRTLSATARSDLTIAAMGGGVCFQGGLCVCVCVCV